MTKALIYYAYVYAILSVPYLIAVILQHYLTFLANHDITYGITNMCMAYYIVKLHGEYEFEPAIIEKTSIGFIYQSITSIIIYTILDYIISYFS